MHKLHIVHRDLKCKNIVFDRPGKNGILKIIDFGESEYIQDDNAKDDKFCGSLHYLSPGLMLYAFY